MEAAKGGHSALLQWAHAHGCPWDTDVCAAAATGGHPAVLQWLCEQGCPWDQHTLTEARIHRRTHTHTDLCMGHGTWMPMR